MKKTISILLVSLVAVFVGTLNVKANYLGFAGSADYYYRKVSESNTKNNYQYLAGIKWLTSDYSDHKMWFQIRNSNGENRGKTLLDGPSTTTKYFNTTAQYGYYYYLYASREHIINPSTYVTGDWQP